MVLEHGERGRADDIKCMNGEARKEHLRTQGNNTSDMTERTTLQDSVNTYETPTESMEKGELSLAVALAVCRSITG
jgi:hypothetical protein